MKNTSLGTGILSVICAIACWFVFGLPLSIASIVLGIIAIVYASRARKEGTPTTAGLILGIIGVIGGSIGLFVMIISYVLMIIAAMNGATIA